jgi:acyl carrier protein
MVKELPDIQSFLKHLERLFDHSSSECLEPETSFRNLPGWTSLQSLVVVISFDEEYGVSISADELQQARTLADLYQLVKDKQGV